jgi:hypothetical protein
VDQYDIGVGVLHGGGAAHDTMHICHIPPDPRTAT